MVTGRRSSCPDDSTWCSSNRRRRSSRTNSLPWCTARSSIWSPVAYSQRCCRPTTTSFRRRGSSLTEVASLSVGRRTIGGPSAHRAPHHPRHGVRGACHGSDGSLQLISLRLLESDTAPHVLDTRTHTDRHRSGVIPGSMHVPRTVLEWHLDPSNGYRHPAAISFDEPIVVVCNGGYSSSLAAANLVDLGFEDVSDLIGGHRAWLAARPPRRTGRPLPPRPVTPTSRNRTDHPETSRNSVAERPNSDIFGELAGGGDQERW